MWDLSCPDWAERLRDGRSLIPELPLCRSEAEFGLKFFDELQLPDVTDRPKLRDAAGQWFRDLVSTSFGSWDPRTQTRFIREMFVMAPKGQSKTSYSAGLMLAVMLMNRRPRAEALFVGPTQAISDRAYEQAVGMIEESPDLRRRFRPRDHIKTVSDLVNQSEFKVKTFELNILTGAILIFVLLDELHLLGRNSHTTKVLRQIRGGLDKTAEGQLLIITTQSDDIPAGAFRDELYMARRIRDGQFKGKVHRSLLPVLYEFPEDVASDRSQWENPEHWPMVMPNLGRSAHLSSLVPDWESEKTKGEHAVRVWASQHLNIEMGIGLKTDSWPGAEAWPHCVDPTLTLDSLMDRSEAIVVGADGGGRDDLFGFAVLGREPAEVEMPTVVNGEEIVVKTKRWLSWSRAWCHKSVLERRMTIAPMLQSFHDAGEMRIVDDELDDIAEMIAIIKRIAERKLLACVALDPAGPYGELVDALAEIGVNEEKKQIIGVPQGYALMNAIKATERKLTNGTFLHAPSRMMDWCVGNVKVEATATAIRATKQNAGDAKIDAWMALMDAATVMVRNPEVAPKRPECRLFFA